MAADLAERMQDLWLAASAAWPGVALAYEDLARHVSERLPDASDATVLAGLNINDLYLACACARGVPGALETFERAYLAHVGRLVAHMDATASFADDVRQGLRERLLMSHGDVAPRISTYHGRGPLLSWLRVAASRVAFDLLNERGGRKEVTWDEQVDLAGGDERDLELDLIKTSYREEFQTAVRDALRALPRRERNLLRLHLVGGVSTHKLGAMFHVDQSTIVRSLAATRGVVREAIRARLREQLRLTSSEVESLAALMLSRLDLSLAGCLQSEPDPE
jgi:RNA polymerase sigma-70 factor (ECF subfamily)